MSASTAQNSSGEEPLEESSSNLCPWAILSCGPWHHRTGVWKFWKRAQQSFFCWNLLLWLIVGKILWTTIPLLSTAFPDSGFCARSFVRAWGAWWRFVTLSRSTDHLLLLIRLINRKDFRRLLECAAPSRSTFNTRMSGGGGRGNFNLSSFTSHKRFGVRRILHFGVAKKF